MICVINTIIDVRERSQSVARLQFATLIIGSAKLIPMLTCKYHALV